MALNNIAASKRESSFFICVESVNNVNITSDGQLLHSPALL